MDGWKTTQNKLEKMWLHKCSHPIINTCVVLFRTDQSHSNSCSIGTQPIPKTPSMAPAQKSRNAGKFACIIYENKAHWIYSHTHTMSQPNLQYLQQKANFLTAETKDLLACSKAFSNVAALYPFLSAQSNK